MTKKSIPPTITTAILSYLVPHSQAQVFNHSFLNTQKGRGICAASVVISYTPGLGVLNCQGSCSPLVLQWKQKKQLSAAKKCPSEALSRPRWIAGEILVKAFTRQDANGPGLQVIFPELWWCEVARWCLAQALKITTLCNKIFFLNIIGDISAACFTNWNSSSWAMRSSALQWEITLFVKILALNFTSEVLIALMVGAFPSFPFEYKGSQILKQGSMNHYICVEATCSSGLRKNSLFPLNVHNSL